MEQKGKIHLFTFYFSTSPSVPKAFRVCAAVNPITPVMLIPCQDISDRHTAIALFRV
ncbi:hypothetical protein [Dendronalium sp. ChiSLP03b]|uniref:hypothetical protein n=1 Tax=Dendronalium sp. ChiSLP03b TaxID=3075381 RepID=UPI002AD977FF|nr:hypothetical protein [Dendronalium sp. ChiSLP03b]